MGCVDDLCMRLAVENQELVERFGLDGLYAFPHPFGCSQLGEDNEMTRQLLASLVNHPNAGAVLVVSLGCENNVPAEFKEAIIRTAGDGFSPDRVKFLVCQEVEDEVAEGSRLLVRLAEYAGQFKRKPIPASELVIDPGVHGKRLDVVQAEEADAVGHLFADAVKAGEVFHGLAVLHGFQLFRVQNSGRGVLGQAVDVFGAVPKLQVQ